MKAVVIGSGFGGLSAALILQGNGYETTLVEALDRVGGRGRVYTSHGYEFEAGPTVVTAPDLLRELYEKAGLDFDSEVELLETTPFYDIYYKDGAQMSYFGDGEKLVAEIEKISPRDAKNYPKFFEQTKKIYNKAFEELVKSPFLSYTDFFKQLPNLVRLRADRSVFGLAKKYFKDPKLQQAFSFHSLLLGGNPTTTTSIYALIHALERNEGVFYAKGGTHAMINNMAENFENLGGTIILNQSVVKIQTRNNEVSAVRLSNGEVIDADVVVSNADVTRTYTQMLGEEVDKDYDQKWFDKKKYTPGLFVTYFATDREYPDLAHHSIVLGGRYEEMLKEIYEPHNILTDDFSLYLHAPKRSDNSRAPDGHEMFYVLSVVPNLKSGTNWDEIKVEYQTKILEELEDRGVIPDLFKHLEFAESFTPADFETVLQSQHGAAFSLQPTLFQSGPFRPMNKSHKVKGLYFSGAGTQPGAGIPGTVASGIIAADLVQKDFPIGLNMETEAEMKQR
ncbi:MAG: phytoene desaturase family protein [Candidatus Kariarchaeaceae archaeon]|jgi:phytoene desaturase